MQVHSHRLQPPPHPQRTRGSTFTQEVKHLARKDEAVQKQLLVMEDSTGSFRTCRSRVDSTHVAGMNLRTISYMNPIVILVKGPSLLVEFHAKKKQVFCLALFQWFAFLQWFSRARTKKEQYIRTWGSLFPLLLGSPGKMESTARKGPILLLRAVQLDDCLANVWDPRWETASCLALPNIRSYEF